MMKGDGPNHPIVVWASWILWIISIFSIFWSLLLFIYLNDTLYYTGTDLVNALVLLSGIVMTPTNLYILNAVAKGKKIEHKAKMVCCPLWMCILWIILINVIGAVLCFLKIIGCQDSTAILISDSINRYKLIPGNKHFIDSLQWSLGCCGLHSYKDWFGQDWHDKFRDYEWEPSIKRRDVSTMNDIVEVDSVPLSCCKSGSCISSYLTELGTHSINTEGCGNVVYKIIFMSANVHLVIFVVSILIELVIIRYVVLNSGKSRNRRNKKFINNIMAVNTNFDVSSSSYQLNPDDSDFGDYGGVDRS